MVDIRVLASVTFNENVVPVVIPESKPLELIGVQGLANVDCVTECGTDFLEFYLSEAHTSCTRIKYAREDKGNQVAHIRLDVRRSVGETVGANLNLSIGS